MPLSLDKLKSMLYSKGFATKQIYSLQGKCKFIEIVSIETGDIFMMYIPKKYKFKFDSRNSMSLKLIHLDEEDKKEVSTEYAESPSADRMEDIYEEVQVETDYTKKNVDDIEKLLEGKYRRPICLKDLNTADSYDVKCVFRQVRRLKYCVQSVRYKLVLRYKKYLCVLHLNDKIDCFYVKNLPMDNHRRIIVTLDLELFYENLDCLLEEILQVKNGITKVLDKNHKNHAKTLQKMLEKRDTIMEITRGLFSRKNELRAQILNFQKLLTQLNLSEKDNRKALNDLSYRNSNLGKLTISQKKREIIAEIKKNHHLKDEIIDNILTSQGEEQHISLLIDKILFDNTVMLDRIFKNLGDLANILE